MKIGLIKHQKCVIIILVFIKGYKIHSFLKYLLNAYYISGNFGGHLFHKQIALACVSSRKQNLKEGPECSQFILDEDPK